jgi:hypothetical protein
LSQGKLLGGFGKAGMFGCGLEADQGLYRWQLAAHMIYEIDSDITNHHI